MDAFYEIALEYDSYNRRQLRIDTSGPVNADGTMLYRINALGRLSNAQLENVTDNRLNINSSITWRPNARTRLTVSATYMIDDMGSAVSYGPMVGMVTPSRFGRISRNLLTGDPAFDGYRKQEVATGYRFE
ncbi:MAG: TonB-dependent siderophore receptor, partial [Janthinobacterium lividum]